MGLVSMLLTTTLIISWEEGTGRALVYVRSMTQAINRTLTQETLFTPFRRMIQLALREYETGSLRFIKEIIIVDLHFRDDQEPTQLLLIVEVKTSKSQYKICMARPLIASAQK